jgi:hypothetical protein
MAWLTCAPLTDKGAAMSAPAQPRFETNAAPGRWTGLRLAAIEREPRKLACLTVQQCTPKGLPSFLRYGMSQPPNPRQERDAMPNFFGQTYKDRQTAAAEAKKALAAKFLEKPPFNPEDPAYIERQAQRRAIVEARDAREAQRAAERAAKAAAEAARLAEEARIAEEARKEEERLAEEARKADEALRELQRIEEAARKTESEAQKKAERDARYAARKARKIERKNELKRYY